MTEETRQALVVRWKERSAAANREATEQHGRDRERAQYCDGQSMMAKLCAVELQAAAAPEPAGWRDIKLLAALKAMADDGINHDSLANAACVIAAAPELLAALKALAADLASFVTEELDQEHERALLAMADAAIAKAEGR